MPIKIAGFTSVLALTAALPAVAEMNFNRIASFAVSANLPAGVDFSTPTSAEIIAATADGMTLIYTDSPLGAVGFVDITDPAAPKAGGSLALGGEPTSVAVLGDATVFVGVNTSADYVEPSGRLAAVSVTDRIETASCDLGGQPDSVALAPDGRFIAVAIENERDEDLNDGEIPQLPAGYVAIVPLVDGVMDCGAMIHADVTGLSEIAPGDPEPEFVDVNANGEIAVTLQENNHIVILGPDGAVLSSFSAGTVDLVGIDTDEEGALTFASSLTGVAREPDAVKWLNDGQIVTANEGDYQGGSRGFTVFNRDGSVAWDSGVSLERAILEIGHYPEERSANKGAEPEGLEFGLYGNTGYLFVLAERASVAAVYRMEDGIPVLQQILPSGISPEGAVAIEGRNLLVTANEVDLIEDGGVRAHVMIYELQDAPVSYPTITSAGTDEPIGWGALSGLAADPETAGRLYAVNDSFYGMQPTVFEIDATSTPARITRAIRVTRDGAAAEGLDLEGVAIDGSGGFWLASEGRTDRDIPHAIYHADADGRITDTIAFPEALLAGETRYGAEGISVAGPVLWLAMQREWGGDPDHHVKLISYNLETGEWGAVLYPLEIPANGWVGLSEITVSGDYAYIVERDNQIGDAAVLKKLYRVPLAEMIPAPIGGTYPVVTKQEVRDFLPDLKAANGYVVDKLEGFAIDVAGTAYAVTDNDGVDDSSGETFFMNLGPIEGM